VCATLPVLQFGDVEEISKEKGRLVNIHNSLNFKQCPIFDYLSYFSALQKFFELEFFMNKVGSVSESVAGLELHCLSGLQFWEDSDESLLLGMDQQEDAEEADPSETEGMSSEDKHNYFLQRRQRIAIKNKLST